MGPTDFFGILNEHLSKVIPFLLQFDFGTVESYTPEANTVVVKLQPSGLPTGDIPFFSPWVSKSGGIQGGPDVGMQVIVISLDRDKDHKIALGYTFNDTSKIPGAPSGEWWILHSINETFVKLVNAGDLLFGGKNHIKAVSPWIQLSNALDLLADPDSVVRKQDLQKVVDSLNAHIDKFNGHVSTYNGHTHLIPALGSAPTATTTSIDLPDSHKPDATGSSVVKAVA